uniref:Sorbitol dehydrogenase n=1 Tax=Aceria tosichella TaxID=561515 RepID=A0A6G1SDV4_9ACAR
MAPTAAPQREAQKTTPTTNGIKSPKSINKADILVAHPLDQPQQRCNLTLVLHEKNKMELEQRPLPPRPRGNEVTLATHTVGICGSDVKYWKDGKIGNFILKKPMVLGHETSAIVMEVGDDVKGLVPGDKVAVEVGLPCSICSLCKTGKYNLCTQMAFAATPPYDGTLTRYFNHPADFCFKLPERVSLEEGALLEPLAVAVHACQRAPINLNDIVLVCGAGAVGLLSMLSAKAFGASHVIITDISPNRLQFARQLGASATYLCERGTSLEQMSNELRDIVSKLKPAVTAQDGPDSVGVNVALECSGAESSLNLAMQTVAVGGTIVCVGCQPDKVTVSLNQAITQEIDIKGVFRYRNCYPLALSLVESGRINLRPLVTHRFRLEDAIQAFETCSRGEGVKIMIQCMEDKKNNE